MAEALSSWPLYAAATTIILGMITALLVFGVARIALTRARPADVPNVLNALGHLLGSIGPLLSGRRGEHLPVAPLVADHCNVQASTSETGGRR